MKFVTKAAACCALVAIACIALAAGVAHAQPPNTPPGVDHYLVYPVLNPPQVVIPLVLSDQFIQHTPYETFALQWFMTPVNKNHEGVIDTVTHYTWWLNTKHPFGAVGLVSNQFGADQALQILAPHFLLNPALKSVAPFPPPTGPLPVKNHYEAYEAVGNPINVNVLLKDQFFPYSAIVAFPRYLATPVEKIFQGAVYPILDPVGHLMVYDLNMMPPIPGPAPPVFAVDEFGTWQLALGPPLYLCVPSFKTGVVGTNATSWGRLKALYR